MRTKTLNIILVISLAFNIAFLGGSIYRHLTFRRFKPVHQRIHNEKVEEFINRKREQRKMLVQDFHIAKDKFMQALSKDEIDEAELLAIIDTLVFKQGMMEKEIGSSMIELRKEMTPQEARQVFGKFRQWMKPPQHFDHNKKWHKPPTEKINKLGNTTGNGCDDEEK